VFGELARLDGDAGCGVPVTPSKEIGRELFGLVATARELDCDPEWSCAPLRAATAIWPRAGNDPAGLLATGRRCLWCQSRSAR
jgi:hypothetical protein